jgi:pilus assembly protein Flp/PilA
MSTLNFRLWGAKLGVSRPEQRIDARHVIVKEVEMAAFKTLLQAYAADKEGATAIEYGLIAAGIAVAIVTILGTMGTNLAASFTTISGAL